MLIMEDLAERQLELKDKYVMVDYDHLKLLAIALGKLNACSFALREQKPDVFKRVQRLNDLLSLIMMTEQTKPLAPRNCQLAASIFNDVADELRWKEKFLSLKDCIWEKTLKLMESQKVEPYGALNHGDCWTNNVMFGYNDTPAKQVRELVLLDWQMARYGSPVLDLISFLFLCGERNIRKDRLDELLTTFHEAFAKTFRALGGDPEKSFPYEAIRQQMKLFGAQVLTMATFAFPILAQLPPKFFESEENRGKEEFQPQFQLYQQLMKDIVRDAEDFDDLE